MRTTDRPMRYSADPRELEYMSRTEGRKLLFLGLLLVLTVFYVFTNSFDSKTEGPEVGIHVPQPPVVTDARAARDTMERVAREQAGEVPATTPTEVDLDPTILQTVDEAALDVVEEPAFYHLMAFVNSLDGEELARAEERHGSFAWEDLRGADGKANVQALNQARGRFITLRGRFLTPLHQRVLARYPNEAGLAWVWQGTFKVYNRAYYVTLLDKDFEPKTGISGTPLELTGAFLKVYRFRAVNDEGGAVKSLPHIVVKSMKRIEAAEVDRYPHYLAWFVAGSATVSILAVLVYAGFSRRSGRKLEGWRRERLKKRLPPKGAAPAKASKLVGSPVTSTTSCPACHEPCEPGPEATVCGDCLTRHHTACWQTSSRCASCGSGDALVAAAPQPPAPPETAERPEREPGGPASATAEEPQLPTGDEAVPAEAASGSDGASGDAPALPTAADPATPEAGETPAGEASPGAPGEPEPPAPPDDTER